MGKQAKPASAGAGPRTQSRGKIKDLKPAPVEPKIYVIEVITPNGWPLILEQWKRVDEVRNTTELLKIEPVNKNKPPPKPTSAKEKDKAKPEPVVSRLQPQPGDASVELECSLVVGGGTTARRDDERDLEFSAARRAWDAPEPGRNLRGAQIRKEFRAEFLEALPPPPSESFLTIPEEFGEEIEGEVEKKEPPLLQGPTPVTESGIIEMSIEDEEEAKYLMMPEQLRDKFIPLYFVPLCTKEKSEEESVVMTPNMADAAKAERQTRFEAAMQRMRDLQEYNEEFILGRQKTRCVLLEKLFVDSMLPPEMLDAIEERGDAIAQENLNRTLSATKKKMEGKKK